MQKDIHITASIVLYNEEEDILSNAVMSFLAAPFSKTLYLIDNSEEKSPYACQLNHPEVIYIFNNKNLGFAKANNVILENLQTNSDYHLILNPDVVFDASVLSSLISQMEKKNELALIAPAIVFPDGSDQYSVRKYPTMFDLVLRVLKFNIKRTMNHEYRDRNLSEPFYPEAIHGCFMLFRTNDFLEINGFDTRYFLYMEDLDICKKIDVLGKKKYYYPKVKVVHHLRKGSSKSNRLLFYHFSSAVKYFLKWI
jgi:GT2 family glycosyltransferase